MEYDKISSGINSQKESFDCLLEKAAAEAGRISLAIQEIAGTTACKGVQIDGLKKWAKENGCWFNSPESFGEFSDREASIEEIAGTLALMGFIPQQDGEYFTNGEVDIFDALPNNVLHGIDGNLYFIDTICLPSNDNFIEAYKSLSPNWNRTK